MSLDITIKEWDYTCGDGCCTSWGKDIYINDQKLEIEDSDPSERTVIEEILKYLGFTDLKITYTYE